MVTHGNDFVRQRELVLIAPQELGKMVVRAVLAEIAEEVIEAMRSRQTAFGGAHITEAPFADERGGIAGLLERFRDRHVLRAQRLGPGVGGTGVASNPGVPVVLSGH